MSETVICRYCEEAFALQLGKPGYRDECPLCLAERALLAVRPSKTRMTEHFAASGLTKKQIAKSVDRFRRSTGQFLRALGLSEEKIQSVLDELEESPTLGQR